VAYHALDVYYNGAITLVIIGVEISQQETHVLVVVHKKNFISKIPSLYVFSILKFILYSCADISINRKDHSLLLTRPTTTEQNPLLLFPFSNPVVFSRTVAPAPIIISPPTTELVRTVPSNFIFPFRPSEALIDQLDGNNNKILRCYPSNEALKPLVGIENWCQQLCAINCSPTLCVCV